MSTEDTSAGFQVLLAIRMVVRRISEHSRWLSREVGMTVPQVLTLKVVAEIPPEDATVGRISDALSLSPATTSRIIDRLESAGLVMRERRAKDRRKVCVSVTDRGRTRYQALPTPLQDRFLRRLNALPPDERDGIRAALARVVELMEAEDAEAAPILAPQADLGDA